MDLPSCPSPAFDHSRPEPELPFTIRSASSPHYSLPFRTKQRVSSEERRVGGDLGRGGGSLRVEAKHREPAQNTEDHMAAKTETHPGLVPLREGSADPATPGQLSLNGAVSKVTAEPAGGAGEGGGVTWQPALGTGMTDRRKLDLSSRSQSLDWRGGRASPEERHRSRVQEYSGNWGEATLKQDESSETKMEGDVKEGGRSRVLSRAKTYDSLRLGGVEGRTGAGLSHAASVLEKAAGGQSLPSRLRPRSGSGCGSGSGTGLRDAAGGSLRTGSQSIWERIEKLYGSEKAEDPNPMKKRNSAPFVDWPLSEQKSCEEITNRRKSITDFVSASSVRQWRESHEGGAGDTFPRRHSRGERNNQETQHSAQGATVRAGTSSPVSAAAGSPSGSPGSVWGRERAPGADQQGKAQGKHLELGESTRGRVVLEYSTRSLDRPMKRFTVAAQIRSDRASETRPDSHILSHSALVEEASTDARDSTLSPAPGDTEERDKGRRNQETECNGGKKMERTQGFETAKRGDFHDGKVGKRDLGKEVNPTPSPSQMNGRVPADPSPWTLTSPRGLAREGSITEDVFEPSSPQRLPPQTGEKKRLPEKLVVPSSASVRNKIHQFEALTQQSQTPSAACYQRPRRALSVPEVLGRSPAEGARKMESARAPGGKLGQWEGAKDVREGENQSGEGMRGKCVGVISSVSDKAVGRVRGAGEEEERVKKRSWAGRSFSVDGAGLRLERGERERETGVQERRLEGDKEVGQDKYPKLSDKMEIPHNDGSRDFSRTSNPGNSLTANFSGRRRDATNFKLSNFNNNSNSVFCTDELLGVQDRVVADLPSPTSDDDKTPTNTPDNSPFYPPEETAPQAGGQLRDRGSSPASTPSTQAQTPTQDPEAQQGRDALVLPLPLTASSPGRLTQPGGDLNAWVDSLNREIEQWDCDEDDDDDGTEKDEDSNYDSDESSVTITSNMSQSDRKSFSLSLADLCNFGGVDYESEGENEDWPPNRSASLSSDVSALSCVSVLGSEELDRLLDDVRGLGDDTLQNYEDVQVVVLHKEVGVGLGFTVAGGEDQNKPVTVHRVFSSGVAAQEGSIREGDLVLSINGTSLSGSAHWEALRTVRKARTLGMGVVVLRRGVAPPSRGGAETTSQGCKHAQSASSGQRVCVRLQKGSRDLGFSLEGGLGSSLGDRPLSIQKIFLGGPVNEVCSGDELLEIQGVNVVGMRRLEAWTLIRRLPPGPVDVVLHRPLKPLPAS